MGRWPSKINRADAGSDDPGDWVLFVLHWCCTRSRLVGDCKIDQSTDHLLQRADRCMYRVLTATLEPTACGQARYQRRCVGRTFAKIWSRCISVARKARSFTVDLFLYSVAQDDSQSHHFWALRLAFRRWTLASLVLIHLSMWRRL